MTQVFEIYPSGTIVKYKLYDEPGVGEVHRTGNIVDFSEELGKYHVGMKLGKHWTKFGMQWVHPTDIREVITDDA